MGHPTRQTFEQLLNAKKCDEILGAVTRCIWEADTRPGEPPITSLTEIQEIYTYSVEVSDENGHIRYNYPEAIDQPFLSRAQTIHFDFNEGTSTVSHTQIGEIYAYNLIAKEKIDEGSTDFFQTISNFFTRFQSMPHREHVEWAHHIWKAAQEREKDLPHPMTQVLREWVKKNPPLCEIEKRPTQIAPAFLKKSHTTTGERLPTGRLHAQGQQSLQLPLFQESEDDIVVAALPIEMYQGGKSSRGAPLDERIFFNALLARPYGTPEPYNAVRLEPTLRDYVHWLYPNRWNRTLQLPLLQTALHEVHNKRIRYQRRDWNIVQVLAMPTEKTKMDDVLPIIIRYPDGVGGNGPMIDVHRMRLYGLVSAPKWRAWIRLHYLWDTAKQRNGGHPIYATIPKVKRDDQGFLLDTKGNPILTGDPYKKNGRWCVRKGNNPQKGWYHPYAIHIGEERNPQCDKIPVLTDKHLVALFFDNTTRENNDFWRKRHDAKNAAMDMEADGVILIERGAIDTKRGIKGWRIIPVYQSQESL